MDYTKQISEQYNIKQKYSQNIIDLLDDGNTIPFIARYRKEMHGSLDDQIIKEIDERLEYLRKLDKGRQEVYSLIDSLGKMTDEISSELENARILSKIEDIYRPYKPKRKTKASAAKEQGLEGLAEEIFAQKLGSPLVMAEKYVNSEKGVENVDDAIQGTMDITAEDVSDNAEILKRLKSIIRFNGMITSKAVDSEKDRVYSTYDYKEPVSQIAGHKVLALDRGEREGFLKVRGVINAHIFSVDAAKKRISLTIKRSGEVPQQ